MLPQQKLIVLSAFATAIVGVIIAWYIHRKGSKKNYLVILLLISLLPIVSILRPGTYESGDLSLNVYKTMALYQSLQDGVFPANWAGVLNATYGYPLFNFTYPLPYYMASLFHFVGFSFLDSLKLVLALSFVLSGIAMYYFLKTLLPPFYAFVGGIFYLFAPYHLVDMHFRVDIGETLAFVFIPLLFLFGTKLLKTYSYYTIVFLSFSICGLLLSHQAVSLAALPFWALYIAVFWIVTKKPFTSVLSVIGATILGFSLAAFYAIPVIFELQYTLQPSLQTISFQNFFEFIYSPWRYGFLFQGHKGELSFLIGYAQLAVVCVSFYLIVKAKLKKLHRAILLYTLFSFFVVFLMMQSFSQPLWYIIPLIENFQFSYRLLSIVVFLTALMAAVASMYIPKKLVFLLLFVAIFSTILNWGNRRNIPEITDAALFKNLPYSTAQGEGLDPANPKWVDPKQPWFKTPPKAHLETVQGTASVKEIIRKTNLHVYQVSAAIPIVLRENTLYFPGWEVYVNGQPAKIQISTEKGERGLMRFSAPKGNSMVTVTYTQTPIRKLGKAITLLSILICALLALIGYKKYSISSS